jgi:translation initiation factor 2 subunit 3
MDLQPIINIGMIGHVSDGKSTITKALTGIVTQKFSQEKQKNITIRLGYANAKIYKCDNCSIPECYYSTGSDNFDNICPKCSSKSILLNHVSFVDCPGHNMLMSTMLNGTSVMDYAIIVESTSNQNIPAPQTIEHLNCVKSMNIPIISSVLNKIDLVSKDKCKEIIINLKKYLIDNNIDVPILPLSATHLINIDILCMIIAHLPKPEPKINFLKMPIIRSFNINKPGVLFENLQGGVVGGSIISGSIKKGEEVFLVPGRIINILNNNYYKPIKCRVQSINSEKNNLEIAVSGGLIGTCLDIDPGLTQNDKLTGNILCSVITGIVTNEFNANIIKLNLNKYDELSKLSKYIFNINSNNVEGKILLINNNIIHIQLDKYQYLNNKDIVTISSINTVQNSITLIGYCSFSSDLNYNNIEILN